MPPTQQCPACGAQTSGKFCSECGAPLGERTCPSCGASQSARAKFCADCGTPLARAGSLAARAGLAPTPSGVGRNLPWIIAAVAILAALAVILVVVTRQPGPAAAAGPAPFDPTRGTTDLSQMTPREAADRLFDRVARADEANDSQQVQFFGPMALQAYADISPLDPDARLHIGLVQLALGNPAGARAQADTMLRASRTHLYGLLLMARAAEAAADRAAARRAYQTFVDNFDAERAKRLPEYDQHAPMLDQTRTEAQRILAATGGGR